MGFGSWIPSSLTDYLSPNKNDWIKATKDSGKIMTTAAVSTPENNIEVLIEEADLYFSQGLNREAAGHYAKVLEMLGDKEHPNRKEIEERLKRLQNHQDDEAVIEGNRPVAETADEKRQRKFENCIGLMDAGFFREAAEEFLELAEENYRPGLVYSKIGECYTSMGMPFDALEYFEKALEQQEITKELRLFILYQLSLIHEKTGSVSKATEALEQLVRLDKNYRNASERLKNLSQSARKYGRFYYLISNEIITEEQLDRAKDLAHQGRKSIESVLMTQFGVEKEDMGKALSEYYRVPFVEFDELTVGPTPPCIHGIKEHFFRTNVCTPIKEDRGVLTIALDDPNDLNKTDNIKRILKARRFEFVVALKEDIDKFIDFFYGKYKVAGIDETEDVFDQLDFEEDMEDEPPEEEMVDDADGVVVQLANKIIEDAFARNASDIHIESLTGRRGAQVRFRIDGDCMRYQTIPFNYKNALISRIKIMSNLDIAEKRLPQDGKIKFKSRTGRTIELRVATLPTTERNEDVVMRILAASDALPIDKLGLLPNNIDRFKAILEMPYGLVLVVGPTGSGKTTTLHAALGYINRPEKKIWTAEDPVEIVQDGLRQVQIQASIDLTFARVLRAFLRADPDVIMVGETRDQETANTVIEASLTGHLVFSTLHTNSAPETITRLLGMGMDPFNFADALLGVLAQRLVKRLCPKCKEPYEPDQAEKEMILKEYGTSPSVPLEMKDLDGITLYRPKGCPACNKTGYKGRLAIHELLLSDDGLRQLIQSNAPVHDIAAHGMENGMLTLKQDGIQKVLLGDTDIKQVKRACIK